METIIELLKITIWPLISIIIVLILKKPISDLINRLKKIGYNKAGIELESQNLQKEDREKKPLDMLGKESNNKNVERVLALFNPETINSFEELVRQETSLDTFETIEEKNKVLFRYSQALYLIKHFNNIYGIIYGSQLRLLQSLNGSINEKKSNLRFFYDFAKENNPVFYEGYTYEQYLGFLKGYNLILFQENENIAITILGRDFLKYLIDTGTPLEKPN